MPLEMPLRLAFLVLFTGCALSGMALNEQVQAQIPTPAPVQAQAQAQAQAPRQENNGPPYENRLIRLAEILGSLHYLSNLCGDKTTLWREQMNALISAEKPDEARRKRLIAGFNNSYRSYADNYNKCTDQALRAMIRFKSEGETLSEQLIMHFGN